MSAPVDRRAVFISKMLDSVSVNYMILAFTAMPALVTYGLGLGYGPLYYLLMLRRPCSPRRCCPPGWARCWSCWWPASPRRGACARCWAWPPRYSASVAR